MTKKQAKEQLTKLGQELGTVQRNLNKAKSAPMKQFLSAKRSQIVQQQNELISIIASN
jgi:hypothetical protein